jgi:uncharacterized protein YkwD
MKNTIKRSAIGLIILLLFGTQSAFAAFSDVSTNNTNYTAISYLEDNNILVGYPDGTFRPENTVNRAEFLKIILEGSNIPLNITENAPFPDINQSAWYAPYIKKAYKEGWVVGYTDGNFKPEQTINKSEALKILGEVQGWTLETRILTQPFDDVYKTAWYTPYISYAKDHNFLEETGPLFEPSKLMTRANISEIIYRTLEPNANKIERVADLAPTEPIISETPGIPESSTSYTPINKNFYENITLTTDLPNKFYKNEVYTIYGTINDPSQSKATVILENASTSNMENFQGEVTNKNFAIPVYFSESGTYNIGILLGTDGQSKAAEINVFSSLPEIPTTESTQTTTNSIDISFAKDKTFTSFSAPSETLKKINFTQNSKTVTYLSRQNIGTIAVQYNDFENFNEGSVSLSFETADLSSTTPLTISSKFGNTKSKTFNATEHSFDENLKEFITINPPDLLNSTGNISINGTLKTEANINAYATKPDGSVDKFPLTTTGSTSDYYGQTLINSGSQITFNYNATSTGRYIIEINDKFGVAILNHPIYIGNKIPLIPDYFDLNKRGFFTGTISLSTMRNDLLNLINQARAEQGAKPIQLSTELNSLAQNHTDDMVTNNYFAHVNLDGQNPESRRIEAGVLTPVIENISKDTSLIFGHLGLMRSAAHRQNILETSWDRVGIGISTIDNYLIIAEEFSTNETSFADLISYKDELISEINNKRTANNLLNLTYDTALENASKDLNDQSIISGISPTNGNFLTILQNNNITGSSQAIGRSFNIWTDILSSILTDEIAIIESKWQKIGVDIQLDSTGNINTMLILNQP